MGLLGSQRVLGRFGGLKPAVPAEQRRQRQASHASAESVQEIPATHLSQARVRSFHPRTNLELTLGHDHSSCFSCYLTPLFKQGSLQEDELVHIDENQTETRQEIAVGVLLPGQRLAQVVSETDGSQRHLGGRVRIHRVLPQKGQALVALQSRRRPLKGQLKGVLHLASGIVARLPPDAVRHEVGLLVGRICC